MLPTSLGGKGERSLGHIPRAQAADPFPAALLDGVSVWTTGLDFGGGIEEWGALFLER